MNIDEEEFQDEFSTFGVNIDNEDIISKLRELCQRYSFDADQIAMEWVAFSSSRDNCKLNFDTLDLLERERLSKKAKKGLTPASTGKKMGKGTVYNLDTIEAAIVESSSILDAYATPNGKSINKRLHTTPENPVNKRLTGLNGTPTTPFSPRSFSPARCAETPSKKYSVRTNAGEVLFTFGPQNVEWKSDSPVPVKVSQYDPNSSLTQRYKYMFQKLVDKATALNDMIDDIGADIQKEHKIEDYSHVSLPAQEEVTVVGRICCDSQGKLNAKSVLLEGSRRTSAGKQIAVDLSELKQYALFPGQVVAMTGLNTNGNKFVAKKFHESVPLPFSCENQNPAAEGPLSILIAVGPYSTSDNLTYEPLADLIKIIRRESPDVCILMGPILDIKNPEIENCQLAEPFEERFQITVDKIRDLTKDLLTRLVFVPSYRDVHHDPIYPQPPYNQKNDARVHFVPDPCVLSFNGVVVGLTSTDVLLHLGTEEISFPPGSSDRLARLTSHLLNQRNFYPLYPPTDEMNIDYPHHEHYGVMSVTPHILVVPSDLRYFVKDINGCCCVNPGRLAKGQIGGSFAKLMVNPSVENKPLIDRISAQVVRI